MDHRSEQVTREHRIFSPVQRLSQVRATLSHAIALSSVDSAPKCAGMIPSAPELGTLWAQSFWSRIVFGSFPICAGAYFNLGRQAEAPESRHQGSLDLVEVLATMERACEPPQ